MLWNALLTVFCFVLFCFKLCFNHLTGFEDRLDRGTSASQPLNVITTPLSSVSYEDDFVSSGSGTLTEKKSALESK
jgi:hypothetical protein